MSEVEVQEVDCVKKKKKKSDEEEEEVEKETPPDKMDLFGEPAMNNAYLICHNVQVYIYLSSLVLLYPKAFSIPKIALPLNITHLKF